MDLPLFFKDTHISAVARATSQILIARTNATRLSRTNIPLAFSRTSPRERSGTIQSRSVPVHSQHYSARNDLLSALRVHGIMEEWELWSAVRNRKKKEME